MIKNILIFTFFVFLGTVLPNLPILGAIALGVDTPELHGGNVNGGMPTIHKLFTRPTASTYRTPNKWLYLCSAASPPGGGIQGMCGHFATKASLSDWPG